jgi:hypothetical protein
VESKGFFHVLHLLNVGYMENHTTIEALPRMINEGFTATASKEDVKALEDRVTTRLDRIETLLMEEQKRKIENLETRMKKLEDALAV